MVGTYIFINVNSPSWIDPLIIMQFFSSPLVTVFVLSILSDRNIATLALFSFQFAWDTLFHSFTFRLCEYLDLESLLCIIYLGFGFVSVEPLYVFLLDQSVHLHFFSFIYFY